jgi:hypothetical protein
MGLHVDPMQVCRYKYRGDVLCIKTAMSEGQKRQPDGYHYNVNTFYAGPIFRELTGEDTAPLELDDWKAMVVCNYYFVTAPDEANTVTFLVTRYMGYNELPLQARESGNVLNIKFDDAYISEVLQVGIEMIDDLCKSDAQIRSRTVKN